MLALKGNEESWHARQGKVRCLLRKIGRTTTARKSMTEACRRSKRKENSNSNGDTDDIRMEENRYYIPKILKDTEILMSKNMQR